LRILHHPVFTPNVSVDKYRLSPDGHPEIFGMLGVKTNLYHSLFQLVPQIKDEYRYFY